MKCPNCFVENLSGKEICSNCGANMVLTQKEYVVPDEAIVNYQIKKEENDKKINFYQKIIGFIFFLIIGFLIYWFIFRK